MGDLHKKILESIQLFTNANTEEIHHETIFDAVLQSLDSKITQSEFINFFDGRTSVIGASFNKNFVLKLYNEYNWLHTYLLVNRSKLK